MENRIKALVISRTVREAREVLRKIQFNTGVGTVAIFWKDPSWIVRIDLLHGDQGTECGADSVPSVIWNLSEQLREYGRTGRPIEDIPWEWFDQSGWTPFQKSVYGAISTIPFGETRSYAWVAQKIGKVQASRAVGQALKKNPIPVVIPCHRVTAVNSLGGFMGMIDPDQPEILLKRRLIELEEKYVNPEFSFIQLHVSA